VIIVLAIGQKVRGFKPSRGLDFLRAITIWTLSSFKGEVKPTVPCRKFSRHIKGPYSMNEIFVAKFTDISCQVSPELLLSVYISYCQRVLVGESGIIRTQSDVEAQQISNGRSVWTPYAIPLNKQLQLTLSVTVSHTPQYLYNFGFIISVVICK
jgi:hypothetical protein